MLRLISDRNRGAQRIAARGDPGAISGEDRRQRLAGLDPISRTSSDHEPDRWIGDVLDASPATTQLDDAAADRLRLDPRHEAAARRGEELAFGGLWEYR